MQIPSIAAVRRLMENTRHAWHATVHRRIHNMDSNPSQLNQVHNINLYFFNVHSHIRVSSVPDGPFVQGFLATKYYKSPNKNKEAIMVQ
jgi:hypothetical protein